MTKKQTPLRIIPLGGLDGIGKNMTAFEYGDDMVLIDAGLMFPDDQQPGIDLVLPDYTYVLEHEEKLRGMRASLPSTALTRPSSARFRMARTSTWARSPSTSSP